jgi:hypothetical protein
VFSKYVYPNIPKLVSPIACFFYPIGIGLIKYVMTYLIKGYNMDDLYDTASLSFAAMPFRFLYLSVDTYPSIAVLLLVKFSYKWNKFLLTPKLKELCKKNN